MNKVVSILLAALFAAASINSYADDTDQAATPAPIESSNAAEATPSSTATDNSDAQATEADSKEAESDSAKQ